MIAWRPIQFSGLSAPKKSWISDFIQIFELLSGPSSLNLSHPNDHLPNRSLRSTRQLVLLLCGHRRGFEHTSFLWIPIKIFIPELTGGILV
jgi:hypothetical protein